MSRCADTLDVQRSPLEGHVAPLLEATASVPERGRRVNFLKGLLLFWLLPKRYGPHLAVGPLWRALAAHAITFLLAGNLIGLGQIPQPGARLVPDRLRITAAEEIVRLAAMSASVGWSWWPVIGVVLAIPAAELLLVVLAVVVMPWCAGGDRAASVFKRSLKNVYWSTAGLFPIILVFGPLAALGWVLYGWIGKISDSHSVLFLLVWGLITLGLPVGLLLRTLLVGASRYVGPADGPAFAPREPRCDACGYLIIGLPLETNCPECGLAVRESLPGGRRRSTEWQRHEFRPRGFVELLRTQWQILRRPDFFQRLPVHEGWSAARHFWWGTYLLIEAAILAGMFFLSVVFRNVPEIWHVGVTVTAPFLLQAAMMFAGCLWAQFVCGIRDYRVSAITCYYAAPLIWPLVAALWLAMLCTTRPVAAASADLETWVLNFLAPYGITLAGVPLNGRELTIVFLAVLGVASLLFWWLRLRRALRAVRYANV